MYRARSRRHRSRCARVDSASPATASWFSRKPIACRSSLFFNDTATTEIYTLSLHDALPIFGCGATETGGVAAGVSVECVGAGDRKSTRLNSSHLVISYAVFCLKKKTET